MIWRTLKGLSCFVYIFLLCDKALKNAAQMFQDVFSGVKKWNHIRESFQRCILSSFNFNKLSDWMILPGRASVAARHRCQ